MRNAQAPARSIRYLLSVDRSLRRVSLREISVRMKNVNRRVRSRSAKKDAGRETASRTVAANRRPSLRPAALVLISIVAAATLIIVLGLVQRPESSLAPVGLAASVPETTPSPAPSLDRMKNAKQPAPTAPVARMHTSDTPAASTRLVDSPRTATVEPVQHPDAIPHVDAIPHTKPRLHADALPNAKLTPPATPTPNAKPTRAAEALTRADVMDEGAVAISGCLEAHDDSFWLRDTVGTNAPTSRSWKSGFLKKHGEPVRVVDATRALRLSNYVRQRVTATGTLTNRTMQARLLELVPGSCH